MEGRRQKDSKEERRDFESSEIAMKLDLLR